MGYRHDRDEILEAATAVLADSGLTGLTFRAVGARLGIPDRTVVYYFSTKEALVVSVVERALHGLRGLLAEALDGVTRDDVEVTALAWDALRSPTGETAFRLALEVAGASARGQQPYRSATEGLVAMWTDFVAERLGGDPAHRRDRAAGVVARLEGLALIRAIAGSEAADAAARGLGLPTSS